MKKQHKKHDYRYLFKRQNIDTKDANWMMLMLKCGNINRVQKFKYIGEILNTYSNINENAAIDERVRQMEVEFRLCLPRLTNASRNVYTLRHYVYDKF